MQLKKKAALMVATLFSVSLEVDAGEITIDTSFLSYEESNTQGDKLNILAPVIKVDYEVAPDEKYSLQFLYDTISGSSPNGAAPSNKAQTITVSQTSGGMNSTIHEANKVPTDDNYKEQRYALSFTALRPISRLVRYSLGSNLSIESDYKSISISGNYIRDFFNKATTLNLGLGSTYDKIEPGNDGYSDKQMQPISTADNINSTNNLLIQNIFKKLDSDDDDDEGGNRSYSKNGFESIIGLTQVVNKYNLIVVNYGVSYVSGYNTDPYKIISVIDSIGEVKNYYGEKRPDTRLKQTIYTQWNTAFDKSKSALHLKYRYYWDDWGIKTNTAEIKYLWQVSYRLRITPHYRWSKQTAADFFTPYLEEGKTLKYASSDRRLNQQTTETIGINFSVPVTKKIDIKLGYSQITQTAKSKFSDAPGALNNQEFYPKSTIHGITFGFKTKL